MPSHAKSRAPLAWFVAGVIVGGSSVGAVAPRAQRVETIAVSPGPILPVDPSAPPSRVITPPPGSVLPSLPPSKPGLACAAGRNGGSTDVGVTGTWIKLATTTVQSGPGQSFLGEVKIAMEAVRQKVNRTGGICGRLIEITYVDDGWSPDRGAQYLNNFMKQDIFAIPVGPSSEGLRIVIDNGDIDRAGIPVVGTDGMLIDQYRDRWVWPIAVATASSARIMARDAYQRGARTFSIVFDKNYKFGAEAAEAYDNEVRRLTGHHVKGFNTDNNCQDSYCGVMAAQPSYSTEVNQFDHADFEALFLEPTTGQTWMATPGSPTPKDVKYGIGAAQPLFTRDFANNCQASCDQMQVWTSYKPPIESYANDPNVRTFVDDLHATKPDADEHNAFSEGGYVGMDLFVRALRAVGPDLTRARLRAALGTLRLMGGLTIQPSLVWPPGNHFANATMQAFTIQYKGTLGGWRAAQIAKDPTPQRGTG